jgi:hypothetical protein
MEDSTTQSKWGFRIADFGIRIPQSVPKSEIRIPKSEIASQSINSASVGFTRIARLAGKNAASKSHNGPGKP